MLNFVFIVIENLLRCYTVYCLLDAGEEAGGVGTVHLRVVELKRHAKRRPKQPLAVLAPNQEGVVEHTAVHAHCTVNVVLCECRSANHHTVGQVVVRTRICHLPRKAHIVAVERRQVIGTGYVARTDLALPIEHNSIHGEGVVLHQFAVHWQEVELFDAAGGFADAIAHQHIELHACLAAEVHKARHVQRLEERDHRHWCLHPHLKGVGTSGGLWVNFLHHIYIYMFAP